MKNSFLKIEEKVQGTPVTVGQRMLK